MEDDSGGTTGSCTAGGCTAAPRAPPVLPPEEEMAEKLAALTLAVPPLTLGEQMLTAAPPTPPTPPLPGEADAF